MSRKPQGHSVAHKGKRVQVILHSGASFVAKFRAKESGFHHFFDHNKVKSNLVNQLRILPTGVEPISYRNEIEQERIQRAVKEFEGGNLTLGDLRKRIKEISPHAKVTIKSAPK